MNYHRLASTYTRLVGKYDQRGTKIKVKIRRNGGIDAATGDYIEGQVKEQAINAVSIDWNENQIDGAMIMRGDIRLILDNAFAVQIGDYVVMDGLEYTVCEPIVVHNPGGVVLGYECNIRR